VVRWRFWVALSLVMLLLLPLLRPPMYVLVLITGVFMNLALAESWTILGGFAGYVSFGHVVFFGIGAYTTGTLLLKAGLNPFLTFPLGGLAAGLFALLIAYPLLKVRGPYFAVITLLVALVMSLVVKNVPFFGGATGQFLPFPDIPIEVNRRLFYYAMLGLATAAAGVTAWVQYSKLGAGLTAIRENEDVAEALAVNTTRVKMITYVISATATGLVGGIYSYMRSYISPEIAFDMHVSTTMFLMALFGGSRHWLGPILGTLALTVVGEALTLTIGAEAARVAYGVFLMLVILYLPEGLAGLLLRKGDARWTS